MCPHKADNPKVTKDNQNQSKADGQQSKNDVKPGHVPLILLNTRDDDSLLQLVGEVFGMAVLDSGCMRTVVGRVWLEENVKMLSESNKKCAKHLPTEDIFWFGDGKEVVASKEVLLFPLIGEKRIVINAKVVDTSPAKSKEHEVS